MSNILVKIVSSSTASSIDIERFEDKINQLIKEYSNDYKFKEIKHSIDTWGVHHALIIFEKNIFE